MKVAILGGGPSGLYLAILLKRRQPDWPVTVIEQNSADSTFGFGVVLADSGLNRLQAADPQVFDQLIAKMNFNGVQTIEVQHHPIDIQHPAKGGAIARIDLLHVLQSIALELGVDVRFGLRIEHPDELNQHGLADADVVVGADGVNSVVRAAYEKEFGTTKYFLTNHFAWYGTARLFTKSALVFREWQGGSFVAHYYPYSSTASTFVAECDDATWHSLGLQSMSNEQRQQVFEQVFAPELKGEPLISNHSNWRQFPVTQNAHWTVGKYVLMGDAQTTAHFSIGSGTRIAMEDAIALADALTAPLGACEPAQSVLMRLDNFAQMRGPAKEKLLSASRKSYLWYEQFGEWMRRYSPYGFIHAFMTRTGRLSEERLQQQYPDLFLQFQREGLTQSVLAGHDPLESARAR